MASYRRSDAASISAVPGALQQRRARAGLCRHRRAVALVLRHAARCLRRRGRSPLDTGTAVVSLPAHLRTIEAGRKVRRRCAAVQRHDSRAPSRQHVGAGLDEHLPAGRGPGIRRGIRSDRRAQASQGRRTGSCQIRRAIFHVSRIPAVASCVLGAIAFHETGRPRRRLPRERVGVGCSSRMSASRCVSR